MKKLILLTFFVVLAVGYAQPTTPVTGISKCVIPFYFTSTGSHAPQAFGVVGYDNRQNGCSNWVLYASNVGFTVVSMLVESAPAAASNLPGTYVSFAGTVVSGVNPFVSTTQASTVLTGFYPWVRVTATLTGSGALVGVLLGNPTPPGNIAPSTVTVTGPLSIDGPTAAGSPPTTPPVLVGGIDGTNIRTLKTDTGGKLLVTPDANSAVNLAQVAGTTIVNGGLAGSQSIGGTAATGAAPTMNPVLIAGLGSGATGGVLAVPTVCDLSAVITVTAGATTQLVALTALQRIRVCSFSVTLSAAGTFQFVDGTGVDCATPGGNLTGALSIGTNGSVNFYGGTPLFAGVVSRELCGVAVTGNATGVLSYAKF